MVKHKSLNLRKIVNVSVCSLLEPLKQLLLNLGVEPCGHQCLLFPSSLAPLNFFLQRNDLLLPLQSELSHSYQVLSDLYQPLLAFLAHKSWPENL